jgi:hypothetical protein
MSNKDFSRLCEPDQLLRRAIQDGPGQIHGTLVTIELIHGFELFNTRPYHNYETWSKGYRVSGFDITVESEDMDDAVKQWIAIYKSKEIK